jgi:ribosomal protein S4E
LGDSIFKTFAAVLATIALTLSTPYTANAVTQIASPDFTALTANFASESQKKSDAERIPQVDNPNEDVKPEAVPELTELTLITEPQEDGLVKVSVQSNVERSSQENPVTIEDADTFTTLKSCYIVSECVITVDPNEHANVLAMSGNGCY